MAEVKIVQLISGAIDLHVHGAPDAYVGRKVNAIELAQQAKDAGAFSCAHDHGVPSFLLEDSSSGKSEKGIRPLPLPVPRSPTCPP